MRWYLEQGAAQEGLRLCGALIAGLGACAGGNEGHAWFGELLALPAAQAPSVERARALGYAGLLAVQQGETAAGQRQLEEALALGRQLGDRRAVARHSCGWLARDPGDPRVRPRLEESLALYRALGDEWGIAEALLNLAAGRSSRAIPGWPAPMWTRHWPWPGGRVTAGNWPWCGSGLAS